MCSHDLITIFKFLNGFQVEEIIFFLLFPQKANIRKDKNNGEEDLCKLWRLLRDDKDMFSKY